MRVDRVDIVTFSEDLDIGGQSGGADGAEFIWVRLHTEDGHIGYGETYPFAAAEKGALRRLAKQIVGQDPRNLDSFWEESFHQQAMRNTGGAEMRALSAFNMSQLDLLGKSAGLPSYRLLGGKTHEYEPVNDHGDILRIEDDAQMVGLLQSSNSDWRRHSAVIVYEREAYGVVFHPV